ncbi:hypothetical protein [Chryseobacterium sp. CFBP8996]|uniref:hypothetical protein n=1 Tax=Chryseobacterium sp. CFBP8996 TaxID=3096529 RepID=UPI002A6A1690|nr:hypothetical protein [Chryseobacterium sp. CFBP8996]MDY0931629.1 hypothetical protein [Chryseobacterium sp. CFBP8996]
MEAIETKLKQLKEVFSFSIPNMELEDIDEDLEEELLTQRYFSEFEEHLESLSDNQPDIDKEMQELIDFHGNEIYKIIPKDLHHELAICIQMDFELIAAYLILGVNNDYVGGMFLSYTAYNEIPMLSLKPVDITLEKAFQDYVDLYITPSDMILRDFHDAFLSAITRMTLESLDESIAESFVFYRQHNQFELHLIELYRDSPIISNYFSEQIKNGVDEISKKLPENLYQDLAHCICNDYEIIATYLINGDNNSCVASMCLSYSKGEIPMVTFDYTNKTLEDAFMEFKMMMKMGEVLEKFCVRRNISFV